MNVFIKFVVVYVWVTGNLVAFGLALDPKGPSCTAPLNRAELLIPGFQLGCWAKQPLFSKDAP